MTKVFRSTPMKRILWLILAVSAAPVAWAGPFGIYQHGTVVRMRMGDCAVAPHPFLAAFGGPAAQMPIETCPEYTLLSEKVVYVIVGRSSTQLIPLADVIDFRIHNNELAVRIDDARHESKFAIREMILRTEWDMVQKHIADQLGTPPQSVDSTVTMHGGH